MILAIIIIALFLGMLVYTAIILGSKADEETDKIIEETYFVCNDCGKVFKYSEGFKNGGYCPRCQSTQVEPIKGE